MEHIKGYEHYTIDREGNIFNTKFNRTLKNKLKKDGYMGITLSKNGYKQDFKLHRLLALAYIPNPEGYHYVRHLNDNRLDNRLCNLAWGTSSQNAKDKYDNGYIQHGRKLTEAQVLEIFEDKRPQRIVAVDYGVSRTTVGKIQRQERYKEITEHLRRD